MPAKNTLQRLKIRFIRSGHLQKLDSISNYLECKNKSPFTKLTTPSYFSFFTGIPYSLDKINDHSDFKPVSNSFTAKDLS